MEDSPFRKRNTPGERLSEDEIGALRDPGSAWDLSQIRERQHCIAAVEAILPYQIGDIASRSLSQLRDEDDLLVLLNEELEKIKIDILRRIKEGA